MKTSIRRLAFRFNLFMGLTIFCLSPITQARAAGNNDPAPAIIQKGFDAWAKNRNASWAFDVWKMGSLMEQDNKPRSLARYFAQMDRSIGDYQSYEIVETKHISAKSEVIYLSIHFANAAVFGRLLMYQTDKDWVVQNMDFNLRPEALMPWLAFEGSNATQ